MNNNNENKNNIISSPSSLNNSSINSPRDSNQTGEQKEVHSLTLKVMRLYKPNFYITHPILCEKEDIPGEIIHLNPNIKEIYLKEIFNENNNKVRGLDMFGLSDFLILPNSLGNIYLGETFTCYISIYNNSPFDVKNVKIKAELQTTTQRYCLLEIGIAVFAATENHDYIISHDIKEGGVYILICTVIYLKHDNKESQFRKFFKFQVKNPVSIKTQTHDFQQGIFVSAQIQNTAECPVYFESVKFDSSPQFNIIDLNSLEDNKQQLLNNILNDIVYLKPGDIHQYLWKLEFKTPLSKTVTTLGKIDILWKLNLGDTGRLQTTTIERKLLNQVELELTIKHIPSPIILEQPFIIQCELTNTSEKSILPRVTFQKNKMTGIFINGISGQHINELPSGNTQNISLTLFPMKPGVQKITGIQIIDEITAKVYDFNDLIDVFVEI